MGRMQSYGRGSSLYYSRDHARVRARTSRFTTTMALFLAVSCFPASAQLGVPSSELPRNWRLPTDAELSGKWRHDTPSRAARADGDFDGDGTSDTALLAVDDSAGQVGLLAHLSNHGRPRWYILDAAEGRDVFMGVGTYPPGSYQILCGEGEGECGSDGKSTIVTTNDSIAYYRFASASSLFVWDEDESSFKRIWESD